MGTAIKQAEGGGIGYMAITQAEGGGIGYMAIKQAGGGIGYMAIKQAEGGGGIGYMLIYSNLSTCMSCTYVLMNHKSSSYEQLFNHL